MTDFDKLIQLASTDTISDELLAAYIDGNTTTEENTFIESSAPMEDLNDISELVADSQSFEEQLHFYDGDYGFWELGIPPVLEYPKDDELLDITSPKYDNLFSQIEHNDLLKKDNLNISHVSEQDESESPEHEEYFEEDDFEGFIDDED